MVTGAGGFIGSHLVQQLLSKNNTNEIYGLYRSFPNFDIPWVVTRALNRSSLHVLIGDIVDGLMLRRIINQYDIDLVYHLAAQSIVSKSQRDIVNTINSNILGTTNILELCREFKFRLILQSTDKVYGDLVDAQVDSPLRPIDLYGITKTTCDQLAQFYWRHYGLPITIVRSCNVYGFDMNWSRLIPGTIERCIHGINPVLYTNTKKEDDIVGGITEGRGGKRQYISIEDAIDFLTTLGFNKNYQSWLVALFSSKNFFTSREIIDAIIQFFPDRTITLKHLNIIEIANQSIATEGSHIFLGLQRFEQELPSLIDRYQEFFNPPSFVSYLDKMDKEMDR